MKQVTKTTVEVAEVGLPRLMRITTMDGEMLVFAGHIVRKTWVDGNRVKVRELDRPEPFDMKSADRFAGTAEIMTPGGWKPAGVKRARRYLVPAWTADEAAAWRLSYRNEREEKMSKLTAAIMWRRPGEGKFVALDHPVRGYVAVMNGGTVIEGGPFLACPPTRNRGPLIVPDSDVSVTCPKCGTAQTSLKVAVWAAKDALTRSGKGVPDVSGMALLRENGVCRKCGGRASYEPVDSSKTLRDMAKIAPSGKLVLPDVFAMMPQSAKPGVYDEFNWLVEAVSGKMSPVAYRNWDKSRPMAWWLYAPSAAYCGEIDSLDVLRGGGDCGFTRGLIYREESDGDVYDPSEFGL